MIRRSCLAAVLVVAATLAGCGKKVTPREFTKEEMEAYVAKKCGLKEVILVQKGDGTFDGSGSDENGRTFRVEATQPSGRVTWKATHKEGSSEIHFSGSEGR